MTSVSKAHGPLGTQASPTSHGPLCPHYPLTANGAICRTRPVFQPITLALHCSFNWDIPS